MKSRMEKYNESFAEYRTRKNQELYKELDKVDLEQLRTYTNSTVIDKANKQIDIEKIKRYIEKMNESDKDIQRKKINEIEQSLTSEETKDETKDYDINSVIEKARNKREVNYEDVRGQKLNNSLEDILKKIEKYNQKYLQEDKEEFNTEEQTLIDLINTISANKTGIDLFDELKGSENTQLLTGIEDLANDESFKQEIKSQIGDTFDYHTSTTDVEVPIPEQTEESVEHEEPIEQTMEKTNTFYTTKNSFSDKDFNEDLNCEDEYDYRYDDNKVSKGKTILIIFATIVLIGIVVVIANYFFDLGLF
ncbi:hypothetical protein EOM09_04140 [bacterium]|nr:hypothetical protein [bacterium]